VIFFVKADVLTD